MMKFLKIGVKVLFIVANLVLLCFILIEISPFAYVRKIYDLGDKYISCEWVAYSDSCRFVFVSKDGCHRAVIKETFEGTNMSVYIPRCGLDTTFIPGHDGKKFMQNNVVEADDIVFEYSTGSRRIYDKDIQRSIVDHGGFNHLFTGRDLDTLKNRYCRVIMARKGLFWDSPQPDEVDWIWPLQNPLIKQYPFGKEARKSGTYREFTKP